MTLLLQFVLVMKSLWVAVYAISHMLAHYIGGLQWVEVLWTSVQVGELYWWLVITVNKAVHSHSQHGARSRILVQVNTNKEEGGWVGSVKLLLDSHLTLTPGWWYDRLIGTMWDEDRNYRNCRNDRTVWWMWWPVVVTRDTLHSVSISTPQSGWWR